MAKLELISSIVLIAMCTTCVLIEAKSSRSSKGNSSEGKGSQSSIGLPLFVKKKTCEKKCHGMKICQRVEDFPPYNWHCRTADCGPLSSPTSGSVATPSGTTVGMDAEYICITGYYLTGNPTRTCQADGQWSGTEPTCNVIVCGALSDPTNGQVHTSTGLEFEKEAIYQCDLGYILTGQTSRWCQSDGNWTGTEPVCSPTVCGALCNPANGQVNTSAGVSFENEATYQCDPGYVLSDQSSRVCNSDGNWNGTEPVCDPVVCGVLSDPADGHVDTSNGVIFGNVAIYQCNLGYVLTGPSSRACGSDGNWNDTEPTCCAIVCGGLSDPANGQVNVSAGLEFENEAIYQCDQGYVLTGLSSRWCQSDGNWTGTEPVCSPIDCGPLEDPCDGTLTTPNGTILDQTADYSCKTGFALVGDDERTCLSTGKWSDNKPCCILDCGSLSAPANGQVSTSDGTLLGDQAVYECNADAHLVGSSTRTCQWDGMWSGMEPQCKICPDPFEYFFDETATCYFVGNGTNEDGFTWSVARDLCLNISGKLAEVKTAPEQLFLVGVLDTVGAGSSTDYWIGGRERRKDNTWVWDSSFTNIHRFLWAKGFPDCVPDKRCLEMCDGCSKKKYAWINAVCSARNQYICETPAL